MAKILYGASKDGGGSSNWKGKARADDLLDEEEKAYLGVSSGRKESTSGNGISETKYDDDDLSI